MQFSSIKPILFLASERSCRVLKLPKVLSITWSIFWSKFNLSNFLRDPNPSGSLSSLLPRRSTTSRFFKSPIESGNWVSWFELALNSTRDWHWPIAAVRQPLSWLLETSSSFNPWSEKSESGIVLRRLVLKFKWASIYTKMKHVWATPYRLCWKLIGNLLNLVVA